jgi:HlyD family secretion protein
MKLKTIVIGVAALAFLAAAGYAGYARGRASAVAPSQERQAPSSAASEPANNQILADGRVVPVSSAQVSFATGGIVAEVLVREGDRVAKGAPLARLDTAELRLGVARAEAALAQARATYDRLLAGATPEEIAAARAQLAQAQAQRRQVGGSVTRQDIAAAEAQVEQARSNLSLLEAGPKPADLQAAQAALDQAEANLQAQRDQLSAAKTQAQLQMQQAALALQESQDHYSEVYWINRSRTIQELDEDEQLIAQSQSPLDEESALRSVQAAEEDLRRATVAYETARQAEVSGVAAAEAQVRGARANLDRVRAGADAGQLAAARAQLAQAEANLSKLRGEQRAANLDAASAAVAGAEANLGQVSAPARPVDLAGAQSQVQQAEVALEEARLALDRATLRAPLDGTVVRVSVNAGEKIGATGSSVTLADLSIWQIETTDLTELSVANIREGDPATIAIDAIPGLELRGRVRYVRPLGENVQGDIIYTVVIAPDRQDQRLRWNMTAAVTIETTL